jgi:hypothetical protein
VTVIVALAAVVVIAALVSAAKAYQPLAAPCLTSRTATGCATGFDGLMEGPGFPGLPGGSGLEAVNNSGGAVGDLYVPPGIGKFSFAVGIENNGRFAVQIEAASVRLPSDRPPGEGEVNGEPVPPWPLAIAGSAEYVSNSPKDGHGRPGRAVAGLSLPAHASITLGFPVRLSYPCRSKDLWATQPRIYLRERFLSFERWVSISLPVPLIMHQPEARGAFGAVCT